MFTQDLNKLIDEAIIKKQKVTDSFQSRGYLGASRIGNPCSRALQYELSSCSGITNPQTLRIFEAGHLFESLIIKWLNFAGVQILTHDGNGNQFGFSAAGGRIAGHIDGVIISAPPELGISCPAIFEAKSMKNSAWNETVKKGLILAKPIYAAQIALYQAYMEESFPGVSKNPCLFTAINKDNSEIYHELIPFDGHLAQMMSDKAVRIITAIESGELLPRSFASREFYLCKMCPFQNKCWSEQIYTSGIGVKND